ncbi:MAG TPA: 2-oxo-4-hydroxy-4-carboxy-5-ureidoimidazoline decarboxylase [Burkholderiales bacterium]|nr:2-oxo-4-hydroxy-4-carboxy-5-ureidoimidazoline decarboxylase [Burkholderiales bacterium]
MELAAVNALGEREFVACFGGVFEHSPWVAERAWKRKPFHSIDSLHQAMMQVVAQANSDERLALVRAHPELAGAEAKEGTLTVDSSSEQGRLGFTRLNRNELEKMAALNRSYREKHGFPCIVALRLHATRETVVAEMERRARNDSSTELENALEQIGHITRARLEKMIG